MLQLRVGSRGVLLGMVAAAAAKVHGILWFGITTIGKPLTAVQGMLNATL